MTEEIRPKGTLEKIVEVHGKKIFIAGIAFLVLVGAWWYYTYQMKPKREAAASEEIFMAQRYFGADSTSAVLNGTGEAMGTIDIASEYKGTKTGRLANFYSGRVLMTEKKYDEAISYFKKTKFSDELMAPLTKCLIGDCYSELEDYDQAVKYYWEAATMRENSYSSPKCYRKAAGVYEKLGNWDKAIEAYETIQKNYPKDIQKYISRAKTRKNG